MTDGMTTLDRPVVADGAAAPGAVPDGRAPLAPAAGTGGGATGNSDDHPADGGPARRPAWVRAVPPRDVYIDAVDRQPVQAWLATLPPAVQPRALAGIYPRIVKVMMRFGDDPVALCAYLEDLMIDRRGGRLGFPPKLAAEIERLYSFMRRRLTG